MDLLEVLADKLGCTYLSDLHCTSSKPGADEIILGLSETGYTLQEFTDTANYILDRKDSYGSIAAAKRAIIDGLKKR